MAQQLQDYRALLELAKRKDVVKAVFKRNADGSTKFKLRGAHKEYTLTEPDAARAEKLVQALSSLEISYV